MSDPKAPAIDLIVTHHTDGFRSGVARFNELLARRMGVRVVTIDDDAIERAMCSLLSFKASEISSEQRNRLAERLRRIDWHGEVFLHEHIELELDKAMVQRASRVHCGNAAIAPVARSLSANVDVLWTPGLIEDHRLYEPTQISVFSFGMAHKIRTEEFRRLRSLLEASGHSYAVYVSAANHETASLRDAQVVFEEMHELFPYMYFLGNLSDVAVYNHVHQTTFFAAFFPGGVRANNTSVAAAMELGAVVITNLDEHSPPEFVHMDNLIDIRQCEELPLDPVALHRMGAQATATGARRGWAALISRLAE